MNKKMKTPIVDSYGMTWYFYPELEHVKCEGDDDPDGGFWCNSEKEAINLLLLYGYIEDKSDLSHQCLEILGEQQWTQKNIVTF